MRKQFLKRQSLVKAAQLVCACPIIVLAASACGPAATPAPTEAPVEEATEAPPEPTVAPTEAPAATSRIFRFDLAEPVEPVTIRNL